MNQEEAMAAMGAVFQRVGRDFGVMDSDSACPFCGSQGTLTQRLVVDEDTPEALRAGGRRCLSCWQQVVDG